MDVALEVNGRAVRLDVAANTLLVDLLRETLQYTGTHVGCDTSQCGSCVVLVDGRAIKSCTVLAVALDGSAVTTIEGLAATAAGGGSHRMRDGSHATADGLHRMQDGSQAIADGVHAEAAGLHPTVGGSHPTFDGLHPTLDGLHPTLDGLHPMQVAFHEQHGLQCGFCTPGMILSAVEMVTRNPAPTEAEVRAGLEGNLCRCTGYQNIVASVMAGAAAMRSAREV